MKKVNILIILLLAIFAGKIGYTQNLNKQWEDIKSNNILDAIDGFKEATKSPQLMNEANLGLALCYAQNENYEEAFNSFQKFYAVAPNPYPYVYALWTNGIIFDGYGKKNDAKLKFLNTVIADNRANGTIKAMAHYMLAKHFQSSNKISKSLEEFAKIGNIENWQMLGTFDNISASGYDKNWGALEKSGINEEFINFAGAKVRWFKVKHIRNDKWTDFAYHFEHDNSIMFAQTWVNSPADIEAFLFSGSSGSMKIWVNDKLVTEVEEERNCDLDVYASGIKLNKGFNRILIQIGESEVGNANFLLRICDEKANPIPGITSTNDNQPYTKASEYAVKTFPFFAEKFFEDQVKAKPDLLNYLLLAETYLRNDKPYESRKAMQMASKLAPQNCLVGIKQIEAYSRDKNYTDLTKTQEKIKTEFPENIYALRLRISEEENKENYDEEEKLLNQMEKLYGNSKYIEMIRLELFANRKNYEELIRYANELYTKYPDDYNLMMLQYNIVQNTKKNLAAANAVLIYYLKNNLNDDVITSVANNYFKLGKVQDGLNMYLKRVDNYPYAIGYYNDLADLYFDQQAYDLALTWQEKARDMAPYHSYYWDKIGKIQEARKDLANASEAYNNAIYFQPSNYDARKQLRKLENKKDLFEGFDCVDPVKVFKAGPKADEYPEDNSIILLNNRQRVVYAQGSSEEKVELIVKIFNKSGIDRWKEYSVGYNSYAQRLIVEKVEVLKKDGSKLKAETNHNEMVFPNLEEGDGIHLIYRIENYGHGKLASHFWDEFNFNYFFPVKSCKYTIITPKDFSFKYKVRNIKVDEKIEDIDELKKYTWSTQDLAAFKSEPYMPPLDDVGGILELSSMPDWNFVANWYSDLASTKSKAKFEVKETVAELFKDKNNLSEYEKGKLIYQYIADNFRYSNVPFLHSAHVPQTASRTISTRLGDCKDLSTLFVAMCKEVGLKSNLVLVDTRDNGDFDFTLPTIGFNHCIARFFAGGKEYYVELTNSKLSFGTLPSYLLNSLALNIPTKTDNTAKDLILLQSNNRVSNSIFRETKVKFELNDMILERRNIRMGGYASGFRSNYADIGREKQEKSMTESISSDFNNPVKLINLTMSDLVTLGDTVKYTYKYKISNELEEVIGIKILDLPWADAYSGLDFVSSDERKFPFNVWEFDGADELKETITLDIPTGKALAEVPKNVSLTCPNYDYSLTFVVAPGKVTVTRKIKMKKDVVPITDYTVFKDFCIKVAEADRKQIGFK